MAAADVFEGADGVVDDAPATIECDVAIVGSGMGGGTLAWALRDSGLRVLVVERGGFVPRERENWSAAAVHEHGRYSNSDAWLDGAGRAFVPGNYHYVGGNSKFFGATMLRLRERDFGELQHRDGVSPAWPIAYADIEPYYVQAERLYGVHAVGAGDVTDPWRSAPAPWPEVAHDPRVAALAQRLRDLGVSPFTLPQAVDWRAGGKCVLCRTCDSFPCLLDAKGDADVRAIRPALSSPTVKLLTDAEVRRVATDSSGSAVSQLVVRRRGRDVAVVADRYFLAAGAVNSAALLLRSAGRTHAAGLANGSGMVGRNYMAHVSSFVVALRPGRALDIEFEKTLGINDWYFAGGDDGYPLGNVQTLGALQTAMIKPRRKWIPRPLLDWIVDRSVDFYVQSEDLPRQENRVELTAAGQVRLTWAPSSVEPHRELVRRTARLLRRAGYPLVFSEQLGVEATAHQCGTARMGDDPTTSVVDADGRCHEVENLWIADASVFPSSAAVNPALTVAANALRVATKAIGADGERSDPPASQTTDQEAA